jgi:transcriptional regulator with XRE-family HTH domain
MESNRLDRQEFGTELQRLRDKTNKTQEELAKAVFVDKNTVSRWERGIHCPDVGIIEEISKFLGLSYPEEYFLLGLAGHITRTRMPRIEQIKEMLAPYIYDIERDPFPSVIIDYRFTQWVKNPKAAVVNGSDEINMYREDPVLLTHIFRREWAERYTTNPIHNQILQVNFFYTMNNLRRHEPFWSKYPECVQNYLKKEDYSVFEMVWNQVIRERQKGGKISIEGILQSINAYPAGHESESVNLKQRIEILPDLPQFATIRFYPSEDTEYSLYKEQLGKSSAGTLTLWMVQSNIQIENLLERYEIENGLK